MPPWIARETLPWVVAAAIVLAVVLALVVGFAIARRRARRRRAMEEVGGRAAGAGTALEAPAKPRERLWAGLAKSRTALAGRLSAALGRSSGGDELTEELEQILIESDVGVRSAERLLEVVRRLPTQQRDPSSVRAALHRELVDLIGVSPEPEELPKRPWVILVVGVNGVGKTTSIGKLAARHRARGRSVLLVAGDTFRAAAIDQLAVWAERTGAQIVRQEHGADPSSVVFDGVQAAVARGVDVVLIDTAGRLHTKVNLMEELRKVRRVIERLLPGAPHEVLLVLDATTGQNAVSQARTFSDAVEVTGVVLTKLDGSARGGVIVAIRHELGLPVRYVGLGESADDLQPFEAESFAEALLGDTQG